MPTRTGASPARRPLRTLLHTPAPSTSPPLALHEVPAVMTRPTDRLLGQPRHRGVQRHERLDCLLGIAVPERAGPGLGRGHGPRVRCGRRRRRRAFGAAGVAAEIVGGVDEGADLAGPGV